jgi:hypothetical protein
MPSNHDMLILPTSELTLSTKMNSHNCNGFDEKLTPQEILDHQAEEWGISMRSEEFARQLDQNDSLKQMRNEFHYPKNASLPKGKDEFHGFYRFK